MAADVTLPWWAVAVVGFVMAMMANQVAPGFTKLISRQSDNTASLAALLARVETMEEKQAAHDGIKEMVTRLDEQLIAMRQQISNQGPVIAQVVAMAIRETFSALGIDRRSAARA